MKVLLLLAGKGRRLKEITRHKHKAFILLQGMPCLSHLLNRLMRAGAKELIPVLGYKHEEVYSLILNACGAHIKITPFVNERFEETNNLGSVLCAREYLEGETFVVCNGDLVINEYILKDIFETEKASAIAVDDSPKRSRLDSPGVTVTDGRIYDLGRHIPFETSWGYALGAYKFSNILSRVYFAAAEKVFASNQDAGFHDPLISLFHEYPVFVSSTHGRSWTDIDKQEDIPHAQNVLRNIIAEEEMESS